MNPRSLTLSWTLLESLMHESSLLSTQIVVLVLLLVACLAAIVAKRLMFPYTVGLVVIGLGLGWLAHHVEPLEALSGLTLSHDLILFLFLPPLIFESAQNMDFRLLTHNLLPVGVLAGPGLLLSTAIVGLFLSWLTPLDFLQACLFGAMISATDPVAVIALFKEFGVPQRLNILIEGESLFNDATAIVIFTILFVAIEEGMADLSLLGGGVFKILVALGGGIAVGLVTAAVLGYLITLARTNALIQGTLSAIVAYATFIIAEHGLHVSGVIAVMTTGLVAGWLNTSRVSPEVRSFLHEFWEYVAFIANSLVFLLIGLSAASFVEDFAWAAVIPSIFWAVTIALLARAVTVYGLFGLINQVEKPPIDRRFQTISFWGGLRGAVALALALSLEPEFPNHDLILLLTLAVVLFTIVSGGTTMGTVLHALKLDLPPVFDRLAHAETVLQAKSRGLQEIKDLERQPLFAPAALTQLKQEYAQALQAAEQTLASLWMELHMTPGLLEQAVWSQAVMIEQQAYQDLRDRGFISSVLFDRLELMTLFKQDSVRCGKIPPPQHRVTRRESRLARWIIAFERQFVPHHPSSRCQREREIENQYPYDMAVAYANADVAQKMRELGHEIQQKTCVLAGCEGIDTAIFNHCAEVYETFSKAAFLNLGLETNQAPEIATSLQAKMASQAAMICEEMAIETLETQGAISGTIATKVRDQLGLS